MYIKIIGVLTVCMLLYYAIMIALDIQKQKAAKAMQNDNANEVDIDITDEANTFRPVYISRDEPVKSINDVQDTDGSVQSQSESYPGADESHDSQADLAEEYQKRPGYREPVMTDGIEVSELISKVDDYSENKQTDLGMLIFRCESARHTS